MTHDPHAPLWAYLRTAAPGRRWVCWRSERTDGDRIHKRPIQPSLRYAHVNAPHTWRSWADVDAAARDRDDIDGLGIVLTGTVDDDGTQLVGIDIDGAIDNGAITPQAMHLVRRLSTLTELSPSETGIHAYIRVIDGMHMIDATGRPTGNTKHPQPWRHPTKRPAIEMHAQRTYLTATGHAWGDPRPVRRMTYAELVDALTDHPDITARMRPGAYPTSPTGRDRIPRAVVRILRDETRRYATRSERDYAATAALVNAGWDDARIIAFLTSTAALGMARGQLQTATRLRDGATTPPAAAARIRHDITKLRTQGDRPDVADLRSGIDALGAHIDALPQGTLTTRRAHETDARVMLAILHTMYAAGRIDVTAPIRDIELRLGAGVGRSAVANALKRLTAAGWLTRTSTGTVTQAATYALGDRANDAMTRAAPCQKVDTYTPPLCVSVHFVSQPDRPLSDDDAARPLVAAIMVHRAIRAAAAAWRAMDGAMLTLNELADALGCHVRTARRHLARLGTYGLVITDGTAHTAVMRPDVIERAAERLGIAQRRDARAAEITAERDGRSARIGTRAAARDRARAGRMLTARIRHTQMTHTPNAPQGRTAPQMTPQGLTPHPVDERANLGRADAMGAVTVSVGNASLTTSADTLATLGTPAHAAGIGAVVDGLRAGDAHPLAADLFGQGVTVTSTSTAAAT